MVNTLTRSTLEERLQSATVSLLDMAKKSSWNKISDNCLYIISETDWSGSLSKADRKKQNDKKEPKPLSDLMLVLLDIYSNVYEFDLYIYKSLKHLTIIEIQYYPKHLLDDNYRQTVLYDAPMLHCKVSIPFYATGFWAEDKTKKFDINWELNPLSHCWKVFWARLKFRFVTKPMYESRLRKQKMSTK